MYAEYTNVGKFENDVKMYGTQTLPSLSTKSP